MKKKILSITSSLVKVLFLIIMCCLAFVVITSKLTGGQATLFGYQFKAVLSGSMEPTFLTGSIIAVKVGDKPTAFQKNEVITFQMENKLITHRIVAVHNNNGEISFTTKGDHNDGPDLWTVYPQNIIGKYSGFTIPYVGYALNYVSSKAGASLLLIIPGLLLTLSALRSFLQIRKEFEQDAAR